MIRLAGYRRTSLGLVAALTACGLLLVPGVSEAAERNRIGEVRILEDAGRTTVVVKGARSPMFTVFRLDGPPRVVVDVAGGDTSGLKTPISVDNGLVSIVDAVTYRKKGAPATARITVGFSAKGSYDVRSDGNDVVITISGLGGPSSPRVTSVTAEALADAKAEVKKAKAAAEEAAAASDSARKATLAALARAEAAEGTVGKAKGEALTAHAAMIEAKKKIRKLEAKVAEADAARRAAAARLASLVEEREAALAKASSAEKAATDADSRAKKAEGRSRKAESAMADALAKVEKRLGTAEAEKSRALREARAAASLAAATADEKAKALTVERSKVEKLERALAEARATTRAAEKTASIAREERDVARSAAADARKELESAKASADALTRRESMLEKDLALARKAADESRATGRDVEATKAAEKVAKLEASLKLVSAEVTKREAGLKAKAAEVALRERELVDAAALLARRDLELGDARKRTEARSDELALRESELSAREVALRKAEKKLNAELAAAAKARKAAEAEVARLAEKHKDDKATHAALAKLERARGEAEAALGEAESARKSASKATLEAASARAREEELALKAAKARSREESLAAAAASERKREEALLAELTLRRGVEEAAIKKAELERMKAEAAAKDAAAAKARAEEVAARAEDVAARAEDAAARATAAADASKDDASRAAKDALARREAAEKAAKGAADRREAAEKAAKDAADRRDAAEKSATAAEEKLAAIEAKSTSTARKLAEYEAKLVAAKSGSAAKKTTTTTTTTALRKIRDVSYEDLTDRSRVRIAFDGDVPTHVVRAEGRLLVLELEGSRVPKSLERALDTSAFGGAVAMVSSYNVGSDRVRVEVSLVGTSGHHIRNDGSVLFWEFNKVPGAPGPSPVPAPVGTKADTAVAARPALAPAGPGSAFARPLPKGLAHGPAPATTITLPGTEVAGFVSAPPVYGSGVSASRRKYTGRPIDLDFKDADIHNLLRALAEVGRVNIVASEDVSGTVTIRMKNVPWDEALDVILKSKKLGMIRDGSVIRVMMADDVRKEFEEAAALAAKKAGALPLQVRLIPVSYARSEDLIPKVKGVLTERGTVEHDERTNLLIVKDIAANLNAAEELVRLLDAETPQVLIEARIIEANSDFEREVGVQWGGDASATSATGNPTGLIFPSDVLVSGGAMDNATGGAAVDGLTPVSGGVPNPNFGVNMPAAVGLGSGGALGLTLGSIDHLFNLSLRLSALEENGTIRIVSAPKIATLDNKEATIEQGVDIPISVVSAAGVNTRFVSADLELKVLPHITADGSIIMKVDITNNIPDFQNTGSRGDPTIRRKEAHTELLVKDGETAVIGGIYTRSTSFSESSVPWFGKIPILGWFFRKKKDVDNRSEVLIFITPRIINRAATLAGKSSVTTDAGATTPME